MFISIKEKLIIIRDSINQTESLIATYLLNCLEQQIQPRSRECSEKTFCSESVLTAFAKKYGYEGFKKLAIRIKVESEYYDFVHKHIQKPKNNNQTKYQQIVRESFELIDNQNEKINRLIYTIQNNKHKNIFVISSYQQLFNTELFVSELQLLGYNCFFNFQRKTNAAWIEKIKPDDLLLIVCFDLDNQYIINYYQILQEKTQNIYIVCSLSQQYKFKNFQEIITIDYPLNRLTILESTRAMQIMYFFSYIIYNLQ